jgi:hypothetical protein
MLLNPVPLSAGLPPSELASVALDLSRVFVPMLLLVGGVFVTLLASLLRETWQRRRQRSRRHRRAPVSVSGSVSAAAAGGHP